VSDFLERIAKLSPKRLALLALELNTKLGRLEQRAAEPIAVTGVGCRFPGGANDPDSFWRLLIEGRDAISEVPPERWDIEAFYDPDPDAPGKMSTRWGGFLDGIEQFDPEFFGISPREAAGMDPQQRLLLEVVWEALENAGQNPDRLAGSQSGVFLGLCNSDYFMMQFEGGRKSIDAYVATGNAHSVASGRISYILGLQGPSLSVDTGCSASLVAVHLACQSLKAGECRMALAGGVNLILMPDTTIFLSKAHMMAPDGRCKPFDASANGFVRSEGCGIIVLKRLSDARADGDRILAVIGGTASNQDGRSNGLTAPNGPSQVAVIREALANAGLQAADIDFIEAHGTGTSLGDPIEARALAEIFGQGRTSEHPLRVGSVKSNFGHAESAAGIAGLIKVLLAMQHGKIPPNLHLEKINPHIDWSGLSINVPTAATSWNPESGMRAAGVSSFGFSGTNAHVTISDPPEPENVSDVSDHGAPRLETKLPLQLLPISARTERALTELVTKYLAIFTAKPDLDLADVCHTAGMGRAHFEYRLTVLAGDLPEAKERLTAFQRGEKPAWIRSGRSKRSTVTGTGLVFMFTGQGSQYPGMGRVLFETQPVFRRELLKCDEILKPLLDKSMLELLFSDESELKGVSRSAHFLDETQYTQPALFALEYALAAMWRAWGVEPAAVLGHSVGEYVAACVAGVFSLEDGLRLIAERGRLMATLPVEGTMAAVFADESRVGQAIAADGNKVNIACVNGPANTVVSGERATVHAVLNRLWKDGIKSRQLAVSHAFHSPLMDPILDSFQSLAAKAKYSEPLIAIVSNVTGKMASPGLMTSPGYWRRHIRNPVRFAESIGTLREAGHTVFLEIGPHPILEGMARTTAPAAEVVWAASLKRGEGNWHSLLDSASKLYVHGVDLEWTALHAACRGKRIALPTYPFQRSRYWLDRRKAESPQIAANPGAGEGTPNLLGTKSENWFYQVEWHEQISAAGNLKESEFHLSADFIPTPGLLADRTASELGTLAKSEGLDIYDQLIPQLEALSGRFINRAFLLMEWSPQPGERFTTRELAERLAVVPAHRRLFERLIAILAEDSILKPDVDGWVVLKPLEAHPSDLQMQAEVLKQQFPACSAEITLTARCAERLHQVLQGSCDPLQLLFPGGDFDTADALYRTSPFARAWNTALRHVVVEATQNAPTNRMVRILEIGAGTGGTTSFLFPHLPAERTRFTFTDVSPLFLTRARDEFRDYPFASFELLDIEKSPATQGFGEQAFDVIVAANVMHATRDLREALGNAVRLLARGGLLILLEATARQRWVDLTFGLTEGWWRFDDATLRPDYALLSVEKWKRVFEETGLEFVHATAPSAGEGDVVRQAILIGRKPVAIHTTNAAAVAPGFWVVLSDTKGIADEVVALIAERGEECVLAAKGQQYNFADGGRATLDPLRTEDFARLFSDALAVRQGPLKGVLNLWPLDEEVAAETIPWQWEAAQARLGGGVLHATQAFLSLPSARISQGSRLWFATRGAQFVLSEGEPATGSCQPAQALVWGLARQISLEHSARFGAVIDLDFEKSSRESAAAIWREIGSGAEEDAVAYRGGRRLVPRVVRAPEPPSHPLRFRADGSYLITGGLGGLGLHLADWMAVRGAGHIVLLSRRDFPARSLWEPLSPENPHCETVRRLLGIEKLGARISVAQGDVADENGMRSLCKRFGNGEPPLRGVVHAAVEMTSRSIGDLDLELFQRACHAKALGGWILNQITLQMELDFFVLFSSVAGLWGAAGLGHYAAACQSLDLLAQWRRQRGLRALSVNWGAWQEIRAASEADKEQYLKSGLHAMPNAQALTALERLISTDQTSAIVASIDWNTLGSVYETRGARPLFAEMRSCPRNEKEAIVSKKSDRADSEINLQLQNASPKRRRDILIAHLRSQTSSILGFDLSRQIELEQGLFDMGMDSLMAVELRGRLERSLSVPLPSTLTFNYPTIRALADYLLSEALQFAAAPSSEQTAPIPPPAPVEVESAAQSSEDLSEDEVSVLLFQKLEQMK
jgi:microcystin synthetase protein McyG